MTGEIFALIAGQSVLRHSVGATGWDDAVFASAVAEGLSHPARLAARLFSLRAEALARRSGACGGAGAAVGHR